MPPSEKSAAVWKPRREPERWLDMLSLFDRDHLHNLLVQSRKTQRLCAGSD